MLLNIQNATVVRGGRRILDNLSLQIADGENVAIVGPNGSGKSTLIKLITRQMYPLARRDQHPVVEIFGRDTWDVFELRSMLGILSNDMHQDFTSDTSISGIEAVLSGFFASKGVPPHQSVTYEMRDRATTALIAADALPLGQKMLAEMSTGEARRVLIARALVSGPRALLLDEPTAGLDLTSRRRFLYAIGQLSRAGKSVILVTHHVEEIFPEIDRVILMKDGKVFDDGPKASILTSERLTALFDDTIRVRHAHGLYSAEIELLSDPG